jgi:hypothetical protein
VTVPVLQGGVATGSGVIVDPSKLVTCSITNNDIAPTLTLIKEVTAATAPETWTLNADAEDPAIDLSGATGMPAVSDVDLTAGALCTLSESVVSGYTLKSLSCSDLGENPAPAASADDPTLTLLSGQDVVCTFTNTRDTVIVVIAKSVSPISDCGTFDLSIDGNLAVDEAVNGSSNPPVSG